jgi:hypothetical protein
MYHHIYMIFFYFSRNLQQCYLLTETGQRVGLLYKMLSGQATKEKATPIYLFVLMVNK